MSSDSTPTQDDERTGYARIRDAAIDLFGTYGVAATSLKMIAEEAGVSQALIVHHFGSKDALRVACDEYVAEAFKARKLEAVAQGQQLDPFAALRDATNTRSGLRYLARTLGDGTPEVAALIDEMIDDAVEYTAEGERVGLVKPSDYPRERIVVLMMWMLGALTLNEHLQRQLGVDMFGPPEQTGPYFLPAVEVLTHGVVPEEFYKRTREAWGHAQDHAEHNNEADEQEGKS